MPVISELTFSFTRVTKKTVYICCALMVKFTSFGVLWFASLSSLKGNILFLSQSSTVTSSVLDPEEQKLHGNSVYCQSVTFNYKLWWWRLIGMTVITRGYRLNSCLTLSSLSPALRPQSFSYPCWTMAEASSSTCLDSSLCCL